MQQLESKPASQRRFGTFGGVFTPTLLTILGVIMYLREGWVIGNAGLLGGLLIIGLAYVITLCTALSMSSITSNLRIGAGGAYAIISQSLGLEVGGSLGIPRYISQALAITLYIFGFREAWLWVFPAHSGFLVDVVVLLALWGIAYKSADLAIRVQYLVMAVIGLSLVSIAAAAFTGSMQYDLGSVRLWGDFRGSPETNFRGTSFWVVFAVFFPAATGIMAGANMSGDLKDPRRSIARGTIAAIGVSLVIYLLLAYWVARSATPEELVENYYVMVDKAYWGWAVIGGVFGATFSSALASMVGAARIMQAMGEHRVVPRASWVGQLTQRGEPRNAMLITGSIVFLSMLLRDLNAIAPFITVFFLVTYAMLNVVVLIEQNLGLISFRPLLRVPRVVPVVGLVGSIFAMFIINPVLSLVSVGVVVVFYFFLANRNIDAPFEDVRSGLFRAFSEWAAKKAVALPTKQERAWKPVLLVPVEDPEHIHDTLPLIEDIAHPQGAVKLFVLGHAHQSGQLEEPLAGVAEMLRGRGIFSTHTVLDDTSFTHGLTLSMQVLQADFFKPNILFLDLPRIQEREEDCRAILLRATALGMGVLIFAPHERFALAHRRHINIWIRDRSPDWDLSWDVGNLNLSVLTAYTLSKSWGVSMRILTVIQSEEDRVPAEHFMERLMDLARIADAKVVVHCGDFAAFVAQAPRAELHLFGLTDTPKFDFMRRMVKVTGAGCLFVRDSGRENVFA